MMLEDVALLDSTLAFALPGVACACRRMMSGQRWRDEIEVILRDGDGDGGRCSLVVVVVLLVLAFLEHSLWLSVCLNARV